MGHLCPDKIDFWYLRDQINEAMRVTVLEEVGRKIADHQRQTNAFGRSEALSETALSELRILYKNRMERLKREQRPPKPANPTQPAATFKPGDEV